MEAIMLCLSKEDLQNMLRDAISTAIEEAKQQLPRFYTRQQVCDMLNITQQTLCNMVSRGDIIQLKIGGRALFDADSIDSALKSNTTKRYGRRCTHNEER